MKGVDDERRSPYLDGPNDVDWIYPNSITQQWMDDLYVGYVREDSEEGGQGKCYWASPRVDDSMDTILRHHTPAIIRLARALAGLAGTNDRPEGVASRAPSTAESRRCLLGIDVQGAAWHTMDRSSKHVRSVPSATGVTGAFCR